ncbi:unnamed protein product [Polarella glacialis]|uniref:Uncharacterized protein n=1 Tax=Polarella glacialis TaxID=89957 RepID=A0A813G8N1_POLGL|nr:unnamed protein product [Polarella glacialis]
MWARRLGVPHLWPSRVKVFFLGILTSVFNFSVFQYLHNANVAYLNFGSPSSPNIVCKLPREECSTRPDPVQCTLDLESAKFWRGLNLTSPCPQLPASVQSQTCRSPWLPLTAISGDLGSLHTVNSGFHPFRLWSILFLALTSLLSISILIHDLALLEESLRPNILSIPNMKYATPCLWDCLTCVQCRRRMRKVWSRNRGLWTVLVFLTSLFQAIAFMAVIYPFALLACVVRPVKMSRIMVFLSSVLCMLWSIVFVFFTAFVDTQPYAVIWGVYEPPMKSSCMCYCEFPLSSSVVWRVVVLGVGVCWHSSNLLLRALKGLRRAQWANMFSVLYSVPIEAFPIIWARPQEAGGGPVQWRMGGEAVQSEPAFDPFCLMDEQPESAWTRPIIAPVSCKDEERQAVWEPYLGTLEMEIGCCGFPRPVGGAWEKEVADRLAKEEEGRGVDSPRIIPPATPLRAPDVDFGESPRAGGAKAKKKRPPQLKEELIEVCPPFLRCDEEGEEEDICDNGVHLGWNSPLAWPAGSRPPSSSSRPMSTTHSYGRRLSDAQEFFHFAGGRHSAPSSAAPSAATSPSVALQGAPTLFGKRSSSWSGADVPIDLSPLIIASSIDDQSDQDSASEMRQHEGPEDG